MADEDDAGVGAVEEPAEPLQAVEVEVVGRLVEQEDVEAGQQHRRQVDLYLLAPGQLGDRAVGDPAGRPRSASTFGTRSVVVAAEGQQPGQGSVVGP